MILAQVCIEEIDIFDAVYVFIHAVLKLIYGKVCIEYIDMFCVARAFIHKKNSMRNWVNFTQSLKNYTLIGFFC